MPIRIGLIGCGGFAGAHVRQLKLLPDVEIAALAASNPATCTALIQRRLANASPPPQVFRDHQSMLAQASLDAVVVITPHGLHAQHAIAALNAGCHVLVEKPMATTVADAEAMVAAARASGRHLMIAYNPLMTRAVEMAKQVVTSGRFGRLQLITGTIVQNWQALTAGTWRQVPETSGHGQISDSGAHVLAGISYLAGAPVESIHAELNLGAGGVPIDGVVVIRFGGDILSTITIGGNCPTSIGRGDLFFERGRLEIDPWNGSFLRGWDAAGPVADLILSQNGDPDSDAPFIDLIRGRRAPWSDGAFGLGQTRLLERIRQSAGR